uniref:hypothetical protein 20 n=1 Tax=Moniliophthora perniciosa TaxID=153609 RepID=UPI0000242355|nr:hypothetical protein 20 [Moniliophthora perniciosa]AAQ74310.1 hypothetical protein 20 [Moniliophthora perniciosa]
MSYFFVFFFSLEIIHIIFNYILNYLNLFECDNSSIYSFMNNTWDNVGNNLPNNTPSSNTNTNSTQSYTGTARNAAIMTSAIIAGQKIAQSSPSVSGRAAIMGGSLSLGTAAITSKNLAENLTSNIGKSKLLSFISNESLGQFFNLTGNDAIDLLTMINYYQLFQLFFTLSLSYNLLIFYVSEEKLNNILSKILPLKIVNYILKYIRILKKSSILVIFCLLILSLIANLHSIYYLSFFIDNIEGIVETCFKK